MLFRHRKLSRVAGALTTTALTATMLVGALAGSAAAESNKLTAGQTLQEGQSITSSNSGYSLLLTTGGLLQEKLNGNPRITVWSAPYSNPNNYPALATMQANGNFLVTLIGANGKSSIVWQTYTSATNGYITVQNNGNVVLYNSSGTAKWKSDTQATGDAIASLAGDNLSKHY